MGVTSHFLFLYWGDKKKLATIRSEFTFKQYEARLQALAYKLALEAILGMNNKEAKFRTHGKEIREIQTDTWHIQFYLRHVSFSPGSMHKASWSDSEYFYPDWGCQVEEKVYADSPHSSKIHFDVGEKENLEEKRAKIMKFLDGLMKGIEPVRRFSLKTIPPSAPFAPILTPEEFMKKYS